ncbi:MAG TPA: YdcF family protein [Vicinamibacterales bacterium]|nr:YdcF family protein [Vicinamibacterales bacterium]
MIRRFLYLVFVVSVVTLVWTFVQLGHILHHEDPLEKADAIFVLGGGRLDRVAEAGELVLEQWAPRIVLSRQESDGAEIAFRQRGFTFPSPEDISRDILIQLGVPAGAVTIIDGEQTTTATESDYLLAVAGRERWRRVIVVTDKMHTARAGLAFKRRFEGTGVAIIMRATRYDDANLDQWWRSRSDVRFALWEAQKFVAYWIGIAD